MHNGYIKIWRKIQDTIFYRKPLVCHLAIHLLLEANHAPNKIIWNGSEMLIERGQVLTGRKQLSALTGLTQQNIRTALQVLTNVSFLTITSTSKFSIITICNYSEYQDNKTTANQVTNQQLTSNQPATNQQLTTNKKNKNVKNDKNVKNKEEEEEGIVKEIAPKESEPTPVKLFESEELEGSNPVKSGRITKSSNSVKQPKVKLTDEEWLESLKSNPAYSGIDITVLQGKLLAWCELKGKEPTRGRLLNWLNREERPMTGRTGVTTHSKNSSAAMRMIEKLREGKQNELRTE